MRSPMTSYLPLGEIERKAVDALAKTLPGVLHTPWKTEMVMAKLAGGLVGASKRKKAIPKL
jgi:hypothetical protein